MNKVAFNEWEKINTEWLYKNIGKIIRFEYGSCDWTLLSFDGDELVIEQVIDEKSKYLSFPQKWTGRYSDWFTWRAKMIRPGDLVVE